MEFISLECQPDLTLVKLSPNRFKKIFNANTEHFYGLFIFNPQLVKYLIHGKLDYLALDQ